MPQAVYSLMMHDLGTNRSTQDNTCRGSPPNPLHEAESLGPCCPRRTSAYRIRGAAPRVAGEGPLAELEGQVGHEEAVANGKRARRPVGRERAPRDGHLPLRALRLLARERARGAPGLPRGVKKSALPKVIHEV